VYVTKYETKLYTSVYVDANKFISSGGKLEREYSRISFRNHQNPRNMRRNRAFLSPRIAETAP